MTRPGSSPRPPRSAPAALDDEAQAADLYSEILELDSTRTDLVEKLAEIKLRRGDFSGLLPLAELLASSAEREPAPERARRFLPARSGARGNGDEAGALDAFRAAAVAEIPSTSPSEATLRGAPRSRQSLLPARGLERGGRRLSERAPRRATALARDAQLVAYERLGIARLRAGAPAEALEPLEKALALDPRRGRALESLVEAARAAGNDDAVVRHTQALLAVTDDPKTKLGAPRARGDHSSRAPPRSAARHRRLSRGAQDLAGRAVNHAPAAGALHRDQAVEAVGPAAGAAGGDQRRGRHAAPTSSPPATSSVKSWGRPARRSRRSSRGWTPTRTT